MIYIIGDSHVSIFSGTDKTHDGLIHIQPEFGSCYTLKDGQLREKINRFEQKIPYFCPVRIGAHTAYNSYNKITKIRDVIDQYKITSNDYIFLSFGEIDIRHHLGYISERTGKSYDEVIKDCVENYLKTIKTLKAEHEKLGVYGAIASGRGTGYGNILTRNKITLLFNEVLRKECNNISVLYKDITKKIILPNGTTNEIYFMDEIHLGQKSLHLINEEFHDIIECDQHGKK